jgi:hypothetical protein
MRKRLLPAATAALIATAGLVGPAMASPGPAFNAVYSLADPPLLQKAQYFWGGRRYCWYFDGWRGPGYYWCGYGARYGFGWGGGRGWHGWGPGYHYGGYRYGGYRHGGYYHGGGWHGGHGGGHGDWHGGHGGGHGEGGHHGGHHH